MEAPSEQVRASIKLRIFARLIDFTLILIIILLAAAFLAPIYYLLVLAIGFIYWIFSDCLPNGQGLGKRLVKIKVLDGATGRSCTIIQAFIRGIFFWALGWIEIFALATDGIQRFGDRIANTFVVRVKPLPPPLPTPPLRPTNLSGLFKSQQSDK
jgi:uncharacterized RDD family membrane protein YckC